ncbi:MFS transporter [Zhihengliuella salsuginis]|uniref:MFS transporter n=1 Tax=Zhihengliuella salsuginis TaxID=578222 RepID=A0ABQ3GBC5_9MICC|nr:MDR family MFS transporter [Zhihengliuella salsuginis]GHD00525.1 MFS transporter [Zhihengliuella salsuginis]
MHNESAPETTAPHPVASGHAPRAAPPENQKLAPAARTTILVLLIAAFVVILNETIMNVALPRLQETFGVTADTVQWLVTAFMLTMAVVIPTTGYLLRRLSIRTAFILAMSLFSAGTLLAALAPTFEILLVGRVIQASGTAIMMPLLMTTILDIVPPAKRGSMMGNVSIVISVAPAIGPTVSGLILQYLQWRMIFFIVLPIAIVALVLGARMLGRLTEETEQSATPLSFPSLLVAIPGFGLLVYGLSSLGGGHGAEPGAAATGPGATPFVALGIAVVALTVFTFMQLRLQRTDRALLDLRPFTYRPFTVSLLLMVMAMVALFGVIILLPMYLQTVRGLDPLGTGLLLLPGGLLMGLLAPFVGRAYDRVGPRPLMIPGGALLVLVLAGYTQLTAETPVWLLVVAHLVMSLSFALLFTPAFTTGLNPLPHHLHSHGSAVLSTLQQLGGAAGTALLVGIMASGTASAMASGAQELDAAVEGFQAGFLTAAFFAVAVFVLTFLMRKPVYEELADSH